MEYTKAQGIIKKLINGTNPLTDEELPLDSVYNQPEIIRALVTLEDCASQPTRKRSVEERQSENVAKGLPQNSGLPWSDTSREEVAREFKEGREIDDLAKEQGRSRTAIIAELKRQGIISAEEAVQYGLTVSW